MTIKTRIAAALTALALVGAVTLPSSEAEARGRGGLVAAGIVGGVLLGAAVASHAHAGPTYYYGAPRRCRWVAQYDGWGHYVGRSRVCYHY